MGTGLLMRRLNSQALQIIRGCDSAMAAEHVAQKKDKGMATRTHAEAWNDHRPEHSDTGDKVSVSQAWVAFPVYRRHLKLGHHLCLSCTFKQ